MLDSIKRYKLNEGIDLDKLLEAGFMIGGWQKEIESPKVSYACMLIDDIELCIEISTSGEIIFDDYKNILIFDDTIGQPYQAFYRNTKFPFLDKVIDKYNKKMDEFVSAGIFSELEKEKVKTKKKKLVS